MLFQIEDIDRCCLRGQCAAVIGFDIYLIGVIEYGRISNPFRCFNAVTKDMARRCAHEPRQVRPDKQKQVAK
jgi:hypothetical protein